MDEAKRKERDDIEALLDTFEELGFKSGMFNTKPTRISFSYQDAARIAEVLKSIRRRKDG